MIRTIIAAAAAAMLLLPVQTPAQETGTGTQDTAEQGGADTTTRTVDEILAMDPRFTLLAHTINQAGLRETLDGDGPFTVFAPVNSAFDKVEKEEFDPYMKDEEKLARLLRHHVVAGPLPAGDEAQSRVEIETLAGDTVVVDFGADPLEIGDARVTEDGIEAKNGTIHAIDRLLLN